MTVLLATSRHNLPSNCSDLLGCRTSATRVPETHAACCFFRTLAVFRGGADSIALVTPNLEFGASCFCGGGSGPKPVTLCYLRLYWNRPGATRNRNRHGRLKETDSPARFQPADVASIPIARSRILDDSIVLTPLNPLKRAIKPGVLVPEWSQQKRIGLKAP